MEPAPRVKMADVAAKAGVSVATVSKVVNGRYGVAKETVELVQGVIDELGYAGNLSASSLRMQQTNVLGILVASFEPFSAELIKGAAAAAEGSGYELLAHSGGEVHGWERRSLARLGGTLIAGAVIVTPTVLDARTVVPVVAVDPHYGPNRLPTIDADSFTGAEQATDHLISLGHTRIAFLGGRSELDSAHLREAGFRNAMAEAGIPVDQALVRETRYQPDRASAVARELLAMPDRPTAIFAANDVTAIRAVEVAHEYGLRVPEDLSVVGFDDVPDAALSSPALTTVRQPMQAMGAAAMTMLLDLINGVEREHHVRMATELIVRGTSAPPPATLRQVTVPAARATDAVGA
ncbi:LacI family DNA-binding transcriptional regulator [Demequina sp. NBRC 110053]|uniref:LacI family DNA-binding transcriptional regulator n=1 Tax=Demequina sp. NBRC 110053 TaxID=1570342 RepID=UPI000A05BE06|nr:LacI family DNA-binding transcriptional regulator [Demequina sp. NBRC 110053]